MGIRKATEERFIKTLQDIIKNGLFVTTRKDMMVCFEGGDRTLDRCINDFVDKGFITHHILSDSSPLRRNSDFYIIRPSCPIGIDSESFQYIYPLQVPGERDFLNGRLCYGYSTALHFHGLMPTIMGSKRYICLIEPSMKPPKGSENWEYKRRRKMPKPAFVIDGVEYYVIRRSDKDFNAMNPESLPIGPRFIYSASALRSLLDAWNHPVFSEGDDRLMEAWQAYLAKTDSRLVGELMRQILKESMESRKGYFEQLGNWLSPLNNHLASVALSFS